jgi:hypothetical protein
MRALRPVDRPPVACFPRGADGRDGHRRAAARPGALPVHRVPPGRSALAAWALATPSDVVWIRLDPHDEPAVLAAGLLEGGRRQIGGGFGDRLASCWHTSRQLVAVGARSRCGLARPSWQPTAGRWDSGGGWSRWARVVMGR